MTEPASDLNARLTEVLNTTLVMPDGSIETATDKRDRHDTHRFLYSCAVCQTNVPAMVTAVLATLAEDPGNLPARMAEVIASHEWTAFPRSAHNQHNYYGECAVCQRDVPRMAEVALGVRDELVASLSARAAVAEAKVEHAEAGAQRSSELLAKVRQEHQAKIASLQAFADRCRERDWAHSAEQAKRREEAERKLHEIAMVKVWTNEDGKRFVFADDLAGILLSAPTKGTTTPARETA